MQINNAGGVGGHELKLITCNDSADPNKAADCARQAVDEGVAAMVGGFTANGDAIMPILEEAGIPWFAPPGISAAELSSEDSYPITSGVLGLAGLGQMAAEDGCDKVASVNYDLPSAGSISPAGRPGADQRGPRPLDADQGPPDHHRLQRDRPGDQRLRLRRGRHPAAGRSSASRPPAPSSAARPRTTSSRAASPTPWPRTAARRSRAPSRSRTSRTSTTRSGTRPRSTSATWRTRRTAAWSGLYFQNTWVGVPHLPVADQEQRRLQRGRRQGHPGRHHPGRHRRVHAAVQLRRGLPGAGAEPGVQLPELTFEIKDGKLDQVGAEYNDMRLALVPAS